MVEIIFKDNQIQSGHRIRIPKAIIDTLDLEEGQKIKIRFDAEEKTMLVEVDNEKKSSKKKKK